MQFRSLSALCLAMLVTASASADEVTADQDFFSLLEEKGFSQKAINQLKPASPGGSSKSVFIPASKNIKSNEPAKIHNLRGNHSPRTKPAVDVIERPEPRIIGGTVVPPGVRGYQVSLQDGLGHFCGGALIDHEWVLTAAHCLEGFEPISVLVGTQNIQDTDAARLSVDAIYVHPDYDPKTFENDIALIHLAQPAPGDLPLLQLADESVMSEFGNSGAMATVSGWGVTNIETGEGTDLLQQVDVPLMSAAKCHAIYDALGISFAETMLCAGYTDGGYDSCYGDSGGSLTLNVHGEEYSVGIVSWGVACAAPNSPAVYSRVASFFDWVIDIVNSEPYVVNHVSESEMDNVSLEAGETRYFKFTPDAVNMLDFEVAVFSDNDDVQFTLYKGEFPVAVNAICSAVVQAGEARCGIRIASQGEYTLELQANNAATEVQVQVSYLDIELGDGTMIDGISLREGDFAVLRMPIHQHVPVITISLTGDNGDAALMLDVYDENNNWYTYCDSFEVGSNESCTLENVEPGWINIRIWAWSDFEDVTLSISYSEPEQPFFPEAICQHSVIQQLGNYFLASINIVNVSDRYLDDWSIEWDYSFDTRITMMLNGIVSGVDPYRAVSSERGRAIAPGGLANLYMLVESPSGLAENPTVRGNYCF